MDARPPRRPNLRAPVLAAGVLALVAVPLAAQDAAPSDAATGGGGEAPAVTLDAGVTLTSRFIYRGINLGEAPQVQPRVALGVGSFEVALWSSHPLAPRTDESENVAVVERGANYREVNLWMRYDIDVGIGTLTPYVQNHYNPNAGAIFDVAGGGEGAHYLQGQLMFSGNAELPVDLLVGYVFHNDPERSVYLEAGYRFAVSETDVRVFAGGVPGRSPFNGVTTDEAAVTNVGVSADRVVRISESFGLPVGFSFVFNPYLEDAFAAVRISL